MGIRFSNFGFDKTVDKLLEVEKLPVEAAKKRKEKVVTEKKEVDKLTKLVADLDKATNAVKTQSDFYHLKVESSHPDIIEGTIKGPAAVGSYEFEVRGLARSDKQLAYGFPDKDQTSVGFGYMEIEREDKEPFEVTVEPGSTLEKVAMQINDAQAGVRAMVINTGYKPDSYRLLVLSEQSGKEAKINIDEDTTFLEFKNQVAGRNLDVLFEDVPITSQDNDLKELLENVNFHIKRAEAGTRVQVSIVHDADATIAGIKTFIEKYNDIVKFSAEQSKSPNDGTPGVLSGDSSVRQIMRTLQQGLYGSPTGSTKYQNLSDIGISTNPKTGELVMDESKVKSALADNYESVANLFIRSKFGDGVGERVAQRIKTFRDPNSGVLKSRMRGLDKIIESQDKDIANRERQLGEKQESIKKRFSSLESQMSSLQAQGQYLAQRFGAANSQEPQGGG
ncbi:MAG: flagellar filament capping protein FliD [Proteobacteria bacterium]|nr:flagellar filament capping protein FliD [Pseudomonadota bacterium]